MSVVASGVCDGDGRAVLTAASIVAPKSGVGGAGSRQPTSKVAMISAEDRNKRINGIIH